jgi:hypothetical protein
MDGIRIIPISEVPKLLRPRWDERVRETIDMFDDLDGTEVIEVSDIDEINLGRLRRLLWKEHRDEYKTASKFRRIDGELSYTLYVMKKEIGA